MANEYTCEDCGTDLPSEHGVAVHRGHVHESVKERYECDGCGTTFERYPSKVTGERVFCTRECKDSWQRDALVGESNPAWAGGTRSYRGPGFGARRREVRDRDNYRCQRCGVTEDELGQELDVHHLRSITEFESWEKANRLDNLLSVCRGCHNAIEPTRGGEN